MKNLTFLMIRCQKYRISRLERRWGLCIRGRPLFANPISWNFHDTKFFTTLIFTELTVFHDVRIFSRDFHDTRLFSQHEVLIWKLWLFSLLFHDINTDLWNFTTFSWLFRDVREVSWWVLCSPYKRRGMDGSIYGYPTSEISLGPLWIWRLCSYSFSYFIYSN